MDKLRAVLKDIKDEINVSIEDYSRFEGLSPEEILIERETLLNVIDFLPRAIELLDDIDREVITLYIVEGWTLQQIGNKLKITHQAVSDRLRKIPTKIQKNFVKLTCKNGIVNILSREDFVPEEGIPFHAGGLTSLGFPFQLLSNCSDKGYWGQIDYQKAYKSKTKCLIPEYFYESFGDNETTCTICDGKKCKRGYNNK